ncbi:MAG TPA: metalloregulator ArsR/SmtB family transcription factor [Acidimicrobiales bacterium]|nr:metalloregulator ArsR/SmtB family transcription factor [Acidimicrobiales bacterium]
MLSVAERPTVDLDLLFGALADATRRAIVERLAVGEATVTELAAPFAISLPAVSRHLKVLERASLITRSKQGRWRGARLSPTSLGEAASWLAAQEHLWGERFGRLDDHLARLAAAPAAGQDGPSTQIESPPPTKRERP